MSEVSECTKVFVVCMPRDLAGSDQVQVMLMPPFTAGELKLALAQKYPVLTDCLAACRWVADNRYLADHQMVPIPAEVALIPPVSGG